MSSLHVLVCSEGIAGVDDYSPLLAGEPLDLLPFPLPVAIISLAP